MTRNNKFHFGYCALTADGLHIGHIEFLERCKEHCYFLIVGIMTDACVKKYKGRKPLMSQEKRKRIVEQLKMVDGVIFQDTFQFPKLEGWFNPGTNYISHHFDVSQEAKIISKWIYFDNEKYKGKRQKADYYFPYNETISSTKIKKYYENPNHSKRKV